MRSWISLRWAKLRAQAPYLPRAMGLVWRAAPGWTMAWSVLLIVQGLLPVATVYLTGAIVDSLVLAMQAGGDEASLRATIALALAMALVLLISELLASLAAYVRTAQAELVGDEVSELIHAQARALDLAYFETPAYFDQLHRARVDAQSRPLALMENLGGLVQNGITLLAMAGVLLTFGLWLPLALLLSTLPAFAVVFAHSKREHRWNVENTTAFRRAHYYDRLLTDRDAAAELRLFDVAGHFGSAYREVRHGLREGRIGLARREVLAQLAAGSLGVLVMGAAVIWMIWQAAQGLYSLGDVALFQRAFSQGQSLLRTLLRNVAQIYANLLFLDNLFEFLGLEPRMRPPASPRPMPEDLRDELRFVGVGFRYPGGRRRALEGLDLVLPAGRITALVGQNGAGKSTVIKLLCRLYDPEEGALTWDGIDLRALDPDALRRRVTVLFQEPVRYHETVATNIALGDLPARPARAPIEAAARQAGAAGPIARLPEGYDTVLGKYFGGSELSVGEWQRLALARAFLRRAPLLVLDEPTSAMDSWAEQEWLSRFRRLAEGRTALLVTHRFTTAMQADRIHVMEGGRIVESGSHGELLAGGGRYASSWRAQMRAAEGAGGPGTSPN